MRWFEDGLGSSLLDEEGQRIVLVARAGPNFQILDFRVFDIGLRTHPTMGLIRDHGVACWFAERVYQNEVPVPEGAERRSLGSTG